MKAITLAVLALAVSLSATPQSPDLVMTSFVTSGEFAYYVAPPRLIVEGEHLGLFFTPDGRYAIVSGQEPSKTSTQDKLKSIFEPENAPTPKEWLKIWDTANGTLREASPAIVRLLTVWSRGMETSLAWTSKPGVAVTAIVLGEDGAPVTERRPVAVSTGKPVVAKHRLGVFRANFVDGSVTQIATVTSSQYGLDLLASPTRPVFVTVNSEGNTPVDRADYKTTLSFQVFDLNGKILKSGEAEVKGSAGFGEWTENGADLLGNVARRSTPGVKAQMSRLVLNLTTGTVSETKENIKPYVPAEEALPLTSNVLYTAAKNGDATRKVPTLWLTSLTPSEEPTCMVAAGVGDFQWLSPKLDRIAYVANGGLFASEIFKMDVDEFHKLKAAAQKRQAMLNAKQIATAMQMYAADADDLMPLHDGFQDSVNPYLKSLDVMNGFVYTYKGGSLSDLKDPANTEIGYISVNGGRAVAYADGHVGFVKDP